jgi:membrane peptidoglycan carboxypeptidase
LELYELLPAGLQRYSQKKSGVSLNHRQNSINPLKKDWKKIEEFSYNQIPGYLQDAQIAAEDKSFWSNDGIDVEAIVRSAFIDAQAQSAQTGASTLTQQVIKNLIDNEPDNKKLLEEGQSPDRSVQRKITEAALSIGITQAYPKWKILEMYFNISPYGAQDQGVEAAAQDLFGLQPTCDANFHCTPAIDYLDRDNSTGKCKNPSNDATCPIDPILGLARASLLASIPQNPVVFDPTVHPEFYDLLLQRQDYTLHQMESAQMHINLGTGSQIEDAQTNGQSITINDAIINQVETMSKSFKFTAFKGLDQAPAFIQWVIQNLANSLGQNQDIDPNTGISISGYDLLLTGGFNVKTTLDANLEQYVEKAIVRHITQPEYQPFKNDTITLDQTDHLHDSAAVVMDAKTGEVLAMDGSTNYNDTSSAGSGQINMAIQPRQPGSSFKPIVVAAAYEMGWYPGIVLPDQKTYFPVSTYSQSEPATDATTYSPTDYGQTYSNRTTTIEQAISDSYNIPALKTEYYVGLQNVYNMAVRLGITSINPKTGLVPSMALGTDNISLI